MYWFLFFLVAAMGVSSSPNNNGVFDIYDRYSNEVVDVLGKGGLPTKGGADYFSYLAARDSRRRQSSPAITFSSGDGTFQIELLSPLYYAKVYVGTPPLPFIVALDTGSSLFWLPCNCSVCLRNITFYWNQTTNCNIYHSDKSSTYKSIGCPPSNNGCPFEARYKDGSSATGVLISDIVHLTTYDHQHKHVQAPVTFGCASNVTGYFRDYSAFNGLLGLGLGNGPDNMDALSILAAQGIVGNSFSLCFQPSGNGTLILGDKGTSNQRETPLDLSIQKYVLYI
ncbi:unnamed protein product [Cuscuta epithymum]|uniref:Peptidase A1 domain-containing protein n=1 Tax=Cuscuta epithymum TaxID=186058 RepID=A0AAV0FL87_9ASTE|nr:unnamed protein product [Cuscuta epithymum]